jgi:DNA-binding NarL/FixJ family response regulator
VVEIGNEGRTVAASSRAEREVREQIAALAARGLTPERLAARIAAALQRVIPGDGYRLFALDPQTRLITRLLAASDDDGWARLEWLRDVYLASEPITYIEHDRLTHWNLPVVAIQPRQEDCWGYHADVLRQVTPDEHWRHYHALRSPAVGALAAQFAAQGRWVAALQLYRRDRHHAFTPDDVTLLRRLQPAIGAALAAALERERAGGTWQSGPDATGVVVLTSDHRITLCTPAAEEWFRHLYDSDRAGHAPVPTAIWSAIAGLRAGAGTAHALTTQTDTGPLRIEASPAGPDGSVSIVLTPERLPTPPQLPAAWHLTTQERRVVELLLRGLSNRAIAAALSVSENTIEWHLRHAYEKLAVRSRAQLQARFFRETWGPTFGVEDAPSG